MIQGFLTRLFGSRNERVLKGYRKTVAAINALEPSMSALTDAELAGKTVEFRERVANGEPLDDLLPEAFAVCREAARRVLGMRHFDVQLVGAWCCTPADRRDAHRRGQDAHGHAPVYLNALAGKGVHVVTVNDYLASRDAEWMGRVYRFLGMSVGIILSQQPHVRQARGLRGGHHLRHEQRVRLRLPPRQHGVLGRRPPPARAALRDRRRGRLDPDRRGAHAADHLRARPKTTPRPTCASNAVPPLLDAMAAEPKSDEPDPPGDYWVDRKAHQVHLSEAGHEKAERILARDGPAGRRARASTTPPTSA